MVIRFLIANRQWQQAPIDVMLFAIHLDLFDIRRSVSKSVCGPSACVYVFYCVWNKSLCVPSISGGMDFDGRATA